MCVGVGVFSFFYIVFSLKFFFIPAMMQGISGQKTTKGNTARGETSQGKPERCHCRCRRRARAHRARGGPRRPPLPPLLPLPLPLHFPHGSPRREFPHRAARDPMPEIGTTRGARRHGPAARVLLLLDQGLRVILKLRRLVRSIQVLISRPRVHELTLAGTIGLGMAADPALFSYGEKCEKPLHQPHSQHQESEKKRLLNLGLGGNLEDRHEELECQRQPLLYSVLGKKT